MAIGAIVVLSVALFIVTDNPVRRTFAVIAAVAATIAVVILFRAEIRIVDGRVQLRKFRAWIDVRSTGIELDRGEGARAGGLMVVLQCEDGRQRALPLQLFSEADRTRLLESLRAVAPAGRPTRPTGRPTRPASRRQAEQ
jgi:hypothetical protein